MATSMDDVMTLFKQARAQRTSDPVGAARTLRRALAVLAEGPADRKRAAAIELELGDLVEKSFGRIDEAIARYQRAFKNDLDLVQAIEAGRRIYRSLGDHTMVARLLEVELDVTADPQRRADLMVQLGRVLLFDVKDLVPAAARLEEALKLVPDDDGARELLATVYAHPDFPPVGDGTLAPRRAVELLVALAEARRRAGDEAGELAFLKRALGVEPPSLEAQLAAEVVFLRKGDRAALRKLYEDSPSLPHRALKLAALAEEDGRRDAALAHCFEALGDPEEGPEAEARLERLLAAANDFAGLAALREQALGGVDGEARVARLVELAELYVKAGQPQAALDRLNEALAAQPAHPGALALAEQILTPRKEFRAVARLQEAAIAALPVEEQAAKLRELAELYERKAADATAAHDAWARAEAISPSEKGAQELRRLGAKLDGWERLLGLLAKELERAADDEARIDVWRRTAQVYRDRHDVETAAALYETVLEKRPTDALAMRALSDLWEREGEHARVAEVLRRQLDQPLQKVERLNLLRRLAVVADERLADPELSVWACREIVRELPGDRDSLKRMAVLCERNGDEDGLLATLDAHAAAAATPAEKGPLLSRVAAILEKRGDLAGAIERLEKVVKLQPNEAAAQESLARLYEAAEKWPELALILERGIAKADLDGWRRFARVVDGKLHDRARGERAWREVLQRVPKDREALAASVAIARQKNDAAALADLLRRLEEVSEPEEAVALARERSQLLETRLKDRAGALAALERLLEVVPRDTELHAELRARWLAAGDVGRAVAVAERELFFADESARLPLAIDIAEMWRQKDLARAAEAYERVLEMDPTHHDAMAALAELLAKLKDWRRYVELLQRRLDLLGAGDLDGALALTDALATAYEVELRDPQSAFHWRKTAWELSPDDERFAALEKVAAAHALWEELIGVHRTMLAADGGLPSLRAIAEVCEKNLGDPRRALEVLVEAIGPGRLDPHGYEVLGEIERLAEAAKAPNALLEVYETLIADGDPDTRLELVARRAKVREASGDPSGAFSERLRHYSLAPDDATVLDELRRLAEATGRWEDLLTVEADRFRRAEGLDKLQVAREAAELVEQKMGDQLRAFRAWLSAFALAPGDTDILAELWRLARAIGRISDGKRPPTSARAVEVQSARKPRGEPTLELGGDDVELLDDVELVPDDTSPAPRVPPPSPIPVEDGHLAWDELEAAWLALPAPTADEQLGNLLEVARMWEEGAADVGRAFDALGRAWRVDLARSDARDAMERLAEKHAAWDALVGLLDAIAAEVGTSERAVPFLLDAAQVRERTGDLADAEARYQRILGMSPEQEEAMARLEGLYRASGRNAELVVLLERRAGGLMERLPPGEERRAKLGELARTYEAMGSPYEAIDAWGRLLAEDDENLDALRAHVRLYEQVGQWSRVIDALGKIAAHAGSDEARAARRRRAEIFEHELELPDRAMEAYADLDDEEARDALERLYAKHRRDRELAALLGRRAQAAPEAQRGPLLERRVKLLESLGDDAQAADAWRELAALRPEDDAVAAALEDALGRVGEAHEQALVLKRRIDAADRRGAPAKVRAELLIRMATLSAGPLDDVHAAQKLLQRALALVPDDPAAIAELARLREGGSDWGGYAAARVREAEVAATPAHAARALIDAARVQAEKLADEDSARKALAKALEKVPDQPEALGLLASLERRRGDDAAADALTLRRLARLGEEDAARAPLSSELGASAMRRGEDAIAEQHFHAALAVDGGHLPALHGLADLAARAAAAGNPAAWEAVEPLLVEAAGRDGIPAAGVAGLLRRVAEARAAGGRSDEAYAALLDADRLVHGDVRTKLLLGENRFAAGRWREAAQHFGAVAEHPEAHRLGRDAAAGCARGAEAELKLRRPERAEALYQRALELAPDYVPALTALAELAVDRGDLAAAADLFERRAGATADPVERAQLYESLGELVLSDLHDADRARVALRRAAEAAGPSVSEGLLARRLELANQASDVAEAAELAEQLLARATDPSVRAERLRESAALQAAIGRGELARERLREALEIDPQDEVALAGLSGLLVTAGDDESAAQLLTRTLGILPPPAEERRLARAVLWKRLGEARDRLRDGRGAAAALERALEINPALRDLREALIARYRGDATQDETARRHLAVLIADDPLHVPSLRSLAEIEARAGGEARARRLLELLAVAGAATDEELAALRRSVRQQPADEPYRGALDDADHAPLAHPDAHALGEVLAVVWDGMAAAAPGLESLGLRAEDRVSPVSDRDVAKVFGACARALGNRKTGLYVNPDGTGVALVAQPPTAVVVGRALADGRVSPSLRFLLGRALEIARPEHVYAAALPPDQFEHLLSTVLRAFHPRHARRAAGDDEVAQLKRKLPYKVAQRLGELFRARPDAEYDVAAWRRGVQHTGNRAGLLVCGDLLAACAVLRAEGDEAGIRELARFAASDAYVQLAAKIG